jgi:glycosyltransferase involved in cell wall biosynthesis
VSRSSQTRGIDLISFILCDAALQIGLNFIFYLIGIPPKKYKNKKIETTYCTSLLQLYPPSIVKILIAATACHPSFGSEAYVGWQAISALRHDHDLWVMTSLSRPTIESLINKEDGWTRVRFVYVDERDGVRPYSENRMIARIQSWMRYRKWCRYACVAAKKLNQEIKFDLGHHVTYATWRMGSPLSGIGLPWIWGPIGGGEIFPLRMIPVLSPVAAIFEIVRAIHTWLAKKSPSVRRAVRDATLVLPNNPETESLLSGLGVPKNRIRRLCQSFLPRERFERFKRSQWMTPRECGEVRLVAGGNLEGRKGVAIAIHALAQLKREGIPFRYTYLGRGPELEHLRSLVNRLKINDRVNFIDSLSGEEYIQALQSGHVYLLPSLREGVPVTQMEAMAAGCVPIVADCGGAGPMARSSGSEPIPVSTKNRMTREIAEAIRRVWLNPEHWIDLSRMSSEGIRSGYSTEHYLANMNEYYTLVASNRFGCNEGI